MLSHALAVRSQLWGSILTGGVACETFDRIENVIAFRESEHRIDNSSGNKMRRKTVASLTLYPA